MLGDEVHEFVKFLIGKADRGSDRAQQGKRENWCHKI